VERPSVLAAVDVGTNSFHLLVARVTGAGNFEVIAREKEVVRLGSGSGDMKRLAPDAVDRGVAALARFRQIAEISGAELRAVATSAVREAENRDEFLRRAVDEAGVDVDVVSGVEEARLIHLGVLQALPVFDRRLLLVDIGGGSTEFVVGHQGEVLGARSLKLGAIRLTDRFFATEPVRRKAVEECRRYVRSMLTDVARDVAKLGYDVAAGSSGTILNVAEMVQAGRGGPPLRSMSGATITRTELDAVVAALAKARTAKDRLKVPGLDPRRADIILGGALLLEQVFAELGVREMVVSDSALREGILLDTIQRREERGLHHLRALRERSVRHLAGIEPEEREHGERAADIALQLYEGLADRHRLPDVCEEWLQAAALLANVGLFISHARHHLHTYYIIRNAEHLTGFTDSEVEIIAQVARYHRKSAPKPSHPEFARLDEADQHVVRVLAGILRIAIALDRTHAGVVRAVQVVRSGRRVAVHLKTGGDAGLEVYTAESRTGLLEDALGVRVRFVVDE
jgi:exopolyphosphatase / guanosine-5'-triphosphate,3'-diphosphate pyrophosphatase